MAECGKWLWGVGCPAIISAGLLIGAQAYDPQPEGFHFSNERQNQEPFVVDLPLAAINVFGGLFAVQAVNHATMLIFPIRRGRNGRTNPPAP